MIRLSVFAPGTHAVEMISAPYFRVCGGAVWTRPGESALLLYQQPRWQYCGVLWSGMHFEGRCRLVFGVPRDLEGMSATFQSLSIEERVLSSGGVPLATYEPGDECWHGLAANVWCASFRIESEILHADADTPLPDHPVGFYFAGSAATKP